MAFERVPPRREAGAGLALPVFNKMCEAHLIFSPSEARAFFYSNTCSDWFPVGGGFVLGDYLHACLGASRFGLPVTLRAICSGFYRAPVASGGAWVSGGLGVWLGAWVLGMARGSFGCL